MMCFMSPLNGTLVLCQQGKLSRAKYDKFIELCNEDLAVVVARREVGIYTRE